MSHRLNFAILSMDAYNRGYDAAIKGLNVPTFDQNGNAITTVKLGNATIVSDSSRFGVDADGKPIDQAVGFYAIAYKYNGVTTISYRGTNLVNGSFPPRGEDALHGWPLGGGIYTADQAELAIKFYRAVVGNHKPTTGCIADQAYCQNLCGTDRC